MLAEFIAALVPIIDLTLKREDHLQKVDKNRLAKNLISILIDLERVEKNANEIRLYFFWMERDASSQEKVEKHKVSLQKIIHRQVETLYALNDRYSEFRPVFEIYMENNELPSIIAKHVLTDKQLYLYSIIRSLKEDGGNFPFTRSETAALQINALRLAKQGIARLIKEHIPMVDFVKWYA